LGIFSFMKRDTGLQSSLTFNFDVTETNRAYLKKMALETVISFIARSISLSDIRVSKNGKRVYDNLHYVFNVRPNTDQSASEFLFEFIYRLLNEGEVLVVPTDDGSLLIADSFLRTEFALYPDIFTNVVIKDFEYKRSFNMDEVIYLRYGNEKLSYFMDGMFQDYTNLFNRMVELNLRSNQIRAVVGIDSNQSLDERRQVQLQKFIDDLFRSFREKTVAIVPKLKGFEYTEVANGSETSRSIDEMTKLKKSLVDEVCDILSVPQGLLHGEISDVDSLMKAYTKFCLAPLNKLIEDELNAKFIEKNDYLKGNRIQVMGIQPISIIENSEAVDKLVASGAYTRNEVRLKFGDEPSDNPALDEYVLTKNYASVSEGGENKNEAEIKE
jgi:HK97 family phage portal protein